MEQGYNETMAHIASVLRPHGIGLGLSINSVCESRSLAVSSDPTCAPAYRDTPWAAVLTDMGTCESADSAVGFVKPHTKTVRRRHSQAGIRAVAVLPRAGQHREHELDEGYGELSAVGAARQRPGRHEVLWVRG